MIGQRGVPASYGGIETAVEELGAELARRGLEVTVYCRRGYGDESLDTHRGMRLVHLPSVERKGIGAFVHAGLSTVHALREPPGVMHFHGIGPGLFSVLGRARGAATVVTVHGMDNQRRKWGGGGRGVLGLGAWVAGHVPDVTLTVSRGLADIYGQRWGRDAVCVPNGVWAPAEVTGADEIEAMGLRPGGYLLYVGRIVPEKSADVLVRAFRRLAGDLQLVVVGRSGDCDEYFHRVQELAAHDERVQVAGYVSTERREQLYAHARAVVFPSLLEGHPIALLEAASFGAPLIASRISAHIEMLGGDDTPGRRLFAPGDEDDLLAAIERSLAGGAAETEAAARFGTEVLARYSWADAAGKTEAAYRDALASRESRGRRAAPRAADGPQGPRHERRGRVVKPGLKQAVMGLGSRVPQRLIDSANNLTSYLELGQQVTRYGFGRPRRFPRREDLFDHVIDRIGDRALLYLEFGVFQGDTTRYWAERVKSPQARFEGFDSFEGLPTTWNAAFPKGRYSVGGALPEVDDDRVSFHKGWFADTLPGYTAPEHDVLFVNVDADLYSSTVTILHHMAPLLTVGSYLYFDEYNDRCHEMKAFDEFLERTGMSFKAVGVVENMWQWLFERVA
jgi:glycosyltransferase involved in cell wall biosynthesis